MKRTIFLNGRRRTLRALMFGVAVALLAVPVAQARIDDALDRSKSNNDEGDAAYVRNFEGTSLGDFLAGREVQVIPYLSHGLVAQPDLVDRYLANQAAQPDLVGPGMAHDMDSSVICNVSGCVPRTVGLPAEDLKAIEASSRPVYFRADDFAPPRNVTVAAATTGVDWSKTAIWLAVGIAGALGLLGAALLANRSRVRVAHT